MFSLYVGMKKKIYNFFSNLVVRYPSNVSEQINRHFLHHSSAYENIDKKKKKNVINHVTV